MKKVEEYRVLGQRYAIERVKQKGIEVRFQVWVNGCGISPLNKTIDAARALIHNRAVIHVQSEVNRGRAILETAESVKKKLGKDVFMLGRFMQISEGEE